MATQTTSVDELRSERHLGEEYLVEVLSSLVRTKSVNPWIYETDMAKRVAAWFEDTPAERDPRSVVIFSRYPLSRNA